MFKHYALILALVVSTASIAFSDITPTTFLQIGEPDRMNQDYVDNVFGDSVTLFFKPSGGASSGNLARQPSHLRNLFHPNSSRR